MEPTQQSVTDFIQTGLSAPILTALNTLGLTTPTPIQAQAIPVARSGHDVMGIAQTGTGKTFAFSLPIIEKLMAGPGKALVVVPTRELAIQVEDSIKRITRLLTPQLRTVCLIGGAPIYRQKQDLRANPRIIVATPGRMWDHIQQRTARLDDVTFVVLDEADRMLDMGFAPQIKQIMDMVSKERQTMCFSATMAPEIAKLAHVYMKEPLRIEVANAGESNAQIRQEMAYVRPEEKTNLLHTLLQDHEGLVLVFSRTKHGARKLTERV
ncbi:MAG TPA: DEAD/DEAH box helicase, partial [Verrucomicrobiae bacterium]|nr:DEAD/DEAH box helicase [Verrucomicrobiae bacterium]